MEKAGVYIHVPFCGSKCPYCDFYSLPFTDKAADAYVDAVIRAIETQPYGELAADTLYLGGGTPILLGPQRLQRILSACVETFGLDVDTAEITLEANPAFSMRTALTQLRRMGFNRVSFGVQSLNPGELAALGRAHSAIQTRRAIIDADRAGFGSISADLMLAIPGQTSESLTNSINTLATLPVNHISAYLLKIEESTPFGENKDALDLPDEDATAGLYLDCVQLLADRGFAQYEISNFARPGNASRHNLKYWQGASYLGIGPSAHSNIGGKRFYFPKDVKGFTQAKKPFSLTVADGASGGFEETAMLRLRLSEGLTLTEAMLSREDAAKMLEKAAKLSEGGLTRVRDNTISLTPAGFLLSTSVTSALLYDTGIIK